MNIIILTTGISGSSVLTGFFVGSGFWSGNKTVYKNNSAGTYETYENSELVKFNELLIKQTGKSFESKTRYSSELRNEFEVLSSEIDLSGYQKFISECNKNKPWIWKDPRLILTIGFWKRLIDVNNTKFIVIHRNIYELWKSQTSKRAVFDFNYLKKVEKETHNDLLEYLQLNNLSFIDIEYDELIQRPHKVILELNKFLGSKLSVDTWKKIYVPSSTASNIKRTIMAYLIYLKNFKNRIR